MKQLFLILLMAGTISISAQNDSLKAYDSIFMEAQQNDKNVILVFGHQACSWCRVFDKYHALPEVKEILDPEFIIHKIDILESITGKQLYDHYILGGTPAWMIFNAKQELLFDGKNAKGNIIGYPFKQNEIDQYLAEIKKASKNMSEPELQVLSSLLKDSGNNREK